MAQLLFYENAVPVSPEQHGDLSIERPDFSFAANVNSVPLTAIELPAAAPEYTIVFAGDKEALAPVVVLGIEGTKNLYVDDKGAWNADYVPAFVRRYPFIFAQSEDKSLFTLCVDEGWSGCNRTDKGQRLFDEKKERTEYLSQMLNFVNEYQGQFVKTQNFCNRLRDLDLLEPMKADFKLPTGESRSLVGFMAVNREKLKALPPEKLAELAKTNELELIYVHLLSMNNFRRILDRAAKK